MNEGGILGDQMLHRLWQAVHDRLCPLLNHADVVLAPRGDWPAFPCGVTLYDELIEMKEATVLILHKGLLTGLPKAELARIADKWQWIFANEVFVVLSRSEKIRKDIRRSRDIVHCMPVIRFLRSCSLRKRDAKIIYIHVPKTGGTSMWAALTRAFPSHVYYAGIQAYLRNPPAPDDYDLVGLHFLPADLHQLLCEGDWVVGMVRHPTDRFLSEVTHSRRESEDPKSFPESARAMRYCNLSDYLATPTGRAHAQLQLITFGTFYCPAYDECSDREILSSAIRFAQLDNVFLGPSEHSDTFRKLLAERLELRPGVLRKLNAKDPATRAVDQEEFNSVIELIDSINLREREFYDFVCRSFSRLQTHRTALGTARLGRRNGRFKSGGLGGSTMAEQPGFLTRTSG